MEAYQSLSNRVASMEELLRKSESTMLMVLQRLKALEEHASASEARHRGEHAARNEELSSRMKTALENQGSRMGALQDAMTRQASALQILEERLQGTLKALEQKTSSGITGCHERLQASESSFTAALRNVESLLQAQSSAVKSLEQNLRADMHSIQQHANGEILGVRQRVEMVDSALRGSLTELHKSISGDIKTLSENYSAKMQSSAQAMDAAILGLDKNVRADVRSLHETLRNDISVVRQSVGALEKSMRDALRALHGTLANDITNLSSRQQTLETAHQVEHQRILADLGAQRQKTEMVDSNWRSGVAVLGEKLQDGWKNILSQLASVDLNLQQKLSNLHAYVEDLSAQLRRTTERLTNSVEAKLNSLEHLHEDVVNNKKAMSVLRDEQYRLREELRGFSVLVERSGMQLRSLLEATVRASHSDLIERMKPLSSNRSEMQTAVANALNKLWTEAHRVFTSQSDMDALQNQIQVLDKAVRNEVALLIERGRTLERHVEEQRRLDVVKENRVSLNPDFGALVPMPVVEELNNVWGELRNIQKQMGMPREEVLSVINNTRKQLFDFVLDVAKGNENEFRDILTQIKRDVCEMVSHYPGPNAVDNRNRGENTASKPKRTIVRVLSKKSPHPPQTDELPPLVRVRKTPNSYPLVEVYPKERPNDLQEAPLQPSTRGDEATTPLPPMIRLSPVPPVFVATTPSLSITPSTSYQ